MVADQAAAAGAADRTLPPYACDAVAVVGAAGSDPDAGLTQAEAASRLSRYGMNEIVSEKPPSVWAVALLQLRDPMNIMLVAVTVVSILIGQVSTGIVVALLILLNVALGTQQDHLVASPGSGVAGGLVAAFQLGLGGLVQRHTQRRRHDRPPCDQET